ncbi:class I SAM-dependent methyltransferase [Virgibacillus proomii]|uniref:class I SAM-dependent methyltransferase n=1 Tax=Virgibacillus proomii TaxID=84407 RepID=UPI001C100A0A|nr:class I SAM-dependent methyltransferase [Virgibacillus proomii]MBU5266444.1 methyltransferase domain-containing protein [Virgibacillus proomii]
MNYLDSLANLGVGGAHPGGLQLTKAMLKREQIGPETFVLDIGCGTGQTAAFIAENYSCSVTAVDNHPLMIEKALKRFKDRNLPVTAICLDIEKLKLDQQFDMIVAESVLAFTDISLSLASAIQVLRPSGRLLAVEIVVDSSMSETDRALIMSFYGFRKLLTEAEWKDRFFQAGFKQIEVDQPIIDPSSISLDDAQDFHFSKSKLEEALNLLQEHQELTQAYEDILHYRIFRCSR